MAGSGHFQRYIFKFTTDLHYVMFAVEKIGTGSRFLTILSACIKAPNVLLIFHVKITFVSSTVFKLL